jgi:hypothetical protein
MDHLKWAQLLVRGLECEIDWNGLIDSLGKTVDAEELVTRLFSETLSAAAVAPNRQPGRCATVCTSSSWTPDLRATTDAL